MKQRYQCFAGSWKEAIPINIDHVKNISLAVAALTTFFSFFIHNRFVTILLLATVGLLCIIGYYSNIGNFVAAAGKRQKLKSVRPVIAFGAALVISIFAFAVMAKNGSLTATDIRGKWILSAVFGFIILFLGSAAPKLSFHQGMGLRFPWTVNDEDTWIVAHSVCGYVSLPLGILCFAGIPTFNRVEGWLLIILLIWVLIPAMVSHTYILKKWNGKI